MKSYAPTANTSSASSPPLSPNPSATSTSTPPTTPYSHSRHKTGQETTLLTLIDTEFTAADTLLDLTLDKLMRRFAETHPALTAACEQARAIHDAPTGKAAPEKPPTP